MNKFSIRGRRNCWQPMWDSFWPIGLLKLFHIINWFFFQNFRNFTILRKKKRWNILLLKTITFWWYTLQHNMDCKSVNFHDVNISLVTFSFIKEAILYTNILVNENIHTKKTFYNTKSKRSFNIRFYNFFFGLPWQSITLLSNCSN